MWVFVLKHFLRQLCKIKLCWACSSASPSGLKPEPLYAGLPVVNTHKAFMCPAHRSFKDPSAHGCFWQHDCFIPDKLGEKPQWLSLEDPSLPIFSLPAASPKLVKWTSYAKRPPLILSRWDDVCVFVLHPEEGVWAFLSAGSGLTALLLFGIRLVNSHFLWCERAPLWNSTHFHGTRILLYAGNVFIF